MIERDKRPDVIVFFIFISTVCGYQSDSHVQVANGSKISDLRYLF